jgi:serine/threonine protein kinase/Tol biopolymer transport system component
MMDGAPTRLAEALAGRYRIERELGAGGMATVYLAQDLKHERQVALKVLKPELAAVLGGDRFVVEIKTTAALQHPHILPLFDSGTADGFLYYVMPYVRGETLRSKLDRETQLGIEEAVRITREVADALDYAHRHGVIHRDIKPENILLHDGRPMVADFGIALALSAAAGGRMTETGLSLGTPHYMSPEQATAEKEITGRSDIYSLGCVLYEMLTGTPPHVGATAQQIVMKIVMDEARPVTELRKSVPANVAAAAAKALEKLPADRFESAKAFAEALTNPAFTVSGLTATRSGSTAPDWRRRAAVPALGAALLLAAALLWAVTRPLPPVPVTRYHVELADGQGLSGSQWSRLAVSPDGSRLVYVGDAERDTRLFVRLRDQLKATAIPGTEGAINPVFSPDGNRIAFMDRVAGGNIKVVSLAGGPATSVTDSAVGAPGLTWGPDGYIYYDVIGIGSLMRVPERGGPAESIGRLDSTRGELQHAWPDALPNGKGLLMTVNHGGPGAGGSEADEIAVLDLATGTHRVLVRGVVARYVRSGHLIYVTATGALMGIPFDLDRMELTGEAVALTEGVSVRTGSGGVDLAVSASGTLWYVAGAVGGTGTLEVVWVERDGSATPVVAGWAGLMSNPVLSPDGKRLAVSIRELVSQVWVKELDQGPLSKLTVESSHSLRPAWSADGRSVAFISERSANRDLYQRLADGSRPATLLLDAERPVEEAVFSRDGAWLIYRTGSAVAEADLYARRLGSDSSIVLLATPANETSPALSPDGRWLAYVSDESGTNEVYVRPFPNTGDGRWQISVQGGQEPLWAPSGRELFYRIASDVVPQQMVMEILPGRTFMPGARRTLFPLTRFVLSSSHPQYAVAPDGRRFAMIRATGPKGADRLVVVENFFAVLRAAPARP